MEPDDESETWITTCPECGGDGTDPDSDFNEECPTCQGWGEVDW